MQFAILVERAPEQVRDLFDRYIDYKMAIAGAMFMGTVVYLINVQHGHEPFWASVAAAKQATYTFFFGGFVTRACQNLAVQIKSTVKALTAAVALPSLFAISATLMIHHLKGTPEPFYSTLPTMLFAPPSFLAIGILYRRAAQKRADTA